LRLSSRRRAIAGAGISAVPSNIERMRVSHMVLVGRGDGLNIVRGQMYCAYVCGVIQ
jgi:hypothetical protein